MIKTIYDSNIEGKLYDNGYVMVKHNDLEDLIMGLGAQIEYHLVHCAVPDVAVECRMTLGNRTITKIGETCTSTTSDKFQKEYVITTAYQRAFDRAAIRILGLGSNVYSYSEIPMKEIRKWTRNEDEKPLSEEVELPPERTEPVQALSAKSQDEEVITSKETVEEEKPQISLEGYEIQEDDVILVGRFSGKTLKQAKESGRFESFLHWLKTHHLEFGDDPERQKQYLALVAMAG